MKGIPQTTKIRQAQCLVQGLQTADSHRKSGQSGTSLPWCNKHPVPTIINDRKVRAQRHLQKSASPTQGLQNVVLALECGLSEGVSGSQSPSPSRMPQHTRRKAFHRKRATKHSDVSCKDYEPQILHRESGLSGTSLLWCDKDIAVGQSAHTKTLFQKHARPTQGLQTVVPALEACVFKSFSGSQSPPSAATPRHTSDGRNSTDNEIPAHRESRAKPTRRRFGTGSPTCQEPCCCRATSITHVIRNCAHKEKHRNRQHAQRQYARLEYRHWNVAFPKFIRHAQNRQDQRQWIKRDQRRRGARKQERFMQGLRTAVFARKVRPLGGIVDSQSLSIQHRQPTRKTATKNGTNACCGPASSPQNGKPRDDSSSTRTASRSPGTSGTSLQLPRTVDHPFDSHTRNPENSNEKGECWLWSSERVIGHQMKCPVMIPPAQGQRAAVQAPAERSIWTIPSGAEHATRKTAATRDTIVAAMDDSAAPQWNTERRLIQYKDSEPQSRHHLSLFQKSLGSHPRKPGNQQQHEIRLLRRFGRWTIPCFHSIPFDRTTVRTYLGATTPRRVTT